MAVKRLLLLHNNVLSPHVTSKSKGLNDIFRDIRTLTYQICRIEEKINRPAKFHNLICKLSSEVRGILKILWKTGEIAHYLLFSTIFCYLLLDSHVNSGNRISFRDKQLFEITEVEITRVDCSL